MADTKKYWVEIVEANDIDLHMIEAGQASVNASLVREMLSRYPLPAGSTLYIPGCGTGQIFDFMQISEFGKVRFLFADIKAAFLGKLRGRLLALTDCEIVLDDLEESTITQKSSAVLVVLVLQHVNWRLALR